MVASNLIHYITIQRLQKLQPNTYMPLLELRNTKRETHYNLSIHQNYSQQNEKHCKKPKHKVYYFVKPLAWWFHWRHMLFLFHQHSSQVYLGLWMKVKHKIFVILARKFFVDEAEGRTKTGFNLMKTGNNPLTWRNKTQKGIININSNSIENDYLH